MNISGTTSVFVSQGPTATRKATRVCGRGFNASLRIARAHGGDIVVQDAEGNTLTPSKGLDWSGVASAVRAGKKVQASVAKPGVPRTRKSN